MSSFNEIMTYYPGNRVTYNCLLKRIKEQSIIPFIGAGLSACYYPSWEELLSGLLLVVPDSCARKAKDQINSHDYFSAADTLCDEIGELLFYECFRDTFDESKIKEDTIKKYAVSLLPKFHFKTYITTNYDRVLEKAFTCNHIQFEIGFPYDTYRLASYMRNTMANPMILKIHGDILSDKKDLILTGKSYKAHYSDGACLKEQLSKWAESKNLLFLGASLYKDETVSVIAERMQEGMINYAIMGVDSSDFNNVKDRLSNVNALPIFYNGSDHGDLMIILQQLLDDLK